MAVTTPLINLLKKGVKFSWSTDCQKTIEMIKAILASEPVLVASTSLSHSSLQWILVMLEWGAVLLQTDVSRIDRPVAYFSK